MLCSWQRNGLDFYFYLNHLILTSARSWNCF